MRPTTRRRVPPPVDMALLERGKERFGIFCAPCHGYEGDGDGAIVRRGFPRPPSYFEPMLMQAPAQLFFDTITNGFGVMYSYGSRVPPHDRWAIAAYIRALQQSRSASLADAPEAGSIARPRRAGPRRPRRERARIRPTPMIWRTSPRLTRCSCSDSRLAPCSRSASSWRRARPPGAGLSGFSSGARRRSERSFSADP